MLASWRKAAKRLIACLHDQNKSGFFGEPTFFHTFSFALIGWKKAGPQKRHFFFDHINRL